MYMKDVINKCKENGLEITPQGIYFVGYKKGFITKKEDGHGINFDKEKFLVWLNEAVKEVPEGYVPVKELPKLFDVKMSMAYKLANDEQSGAIKVASKKGVTYVDPKRIEEIINKRHKYDWNEGEENE